MISPTAICQLLDNGDDIHGSISVLQDSLYTSVVTIRLTHIDQGAYTLLFHENAIDGTD